MEPQPAKALAALLARPGELVTRDELRAALWGAATHVDFDRGLTYAIGQVRAALGDSGENPRFVQTLPKRGFRFIAPVTAEGQSGGGGTSDPAVHASSTEPAGVTHVMATAQAEGSALRTVSRPRQAARGRLPRTWLIAAAVLAAAVASLGAVLWARTAPRVIAVSVFDNETGDVAYDVPVAAMTDLAVVRLAGLAPGRLGVVGNAAVLRRPRNIRDLQAAASGVRADCVVLGQIQRDPAGLRFVTHLVRLRDGVHLKANRLTVAADGLATLEQAVPDEFARAVREHVLGARGPDARR